MRLIVNGNDITRAVISLELNSFLTTLGDTLEFDIPYSDLIKYNIAEIQVGDKVELYDDHQIFRGLITAYNNDLSLRAYTAHDFCYYLNKSKIIMQFNEGDSISDAIKQLWDKVGVTYVNLPQMRGIIGEDDTFYKQTPAEILKTLLQKEEDVSGITYYAYNNGVGRRIDINEVGLYKVSFSVDTEAISDPTKEANLDDVKNSYIYYDTETDEEAASYRDESSIKRYGLLQEIIEGSDSDNAAEAVKNRTWMTRNLLPKGNITTIGNWYCLRGYKVTLKEKVTGLVGDYIIEGVTHHYDDTGHFMTLDLKQAQMIRLAKLINPELPSASEWKVIL